MTPVDGGHGMLTVGSCAAEHHEPGQIRKEAALSGSFRVTQDGLTRVHAHHLRRDEVSTAGARSLLPEPSPVDEAEQTHAPDFLGGQGVTLEQAFRWGQ